MVTGISESLQAATGTAGGVEISALLLPPPPPHAASDISRAMELRRSEVGAGTVQGKGAGVTARVLLATGGGERSVRKAAGTIHGKAGAAGVGLQAQRELVPHVATAARPAFVASPASAASFGRGVISGSSSRPTRPTTESITRVVG